MLKMLIVLNNMIANAHCATEFAVIMKQLSVVKLMTLMSSKIKEIQDQALWILDNICQDFDVFRQLLLDSGVLHEISNVSFVPF
jgi:hypothetical protein